MLTSDLAKEALNTFGDDIPGFGNLIAPIKAILIAVIDDIISKLDNFVDDLRLGAGAAFLLIRTNLDDLLDELEESIFSTLINILEDLASEIVKLSGKVLSSDL